MVPEQPDYGHHRVATSQAAVAQTHELIEQTRRRVRDSRALVLSGLPQAEPGAHSAAPAHTTVALADLVIATRYLPAGAGADPIAGDFCDVLHLGPDRLGIVLGDVTGHGIPAAKRMRALRGAARTAAGADVRPRALLHQLDLLLEAEPQDWLATLWFAHYTPSTGVLTYASAGHPPPVLTCPGQPARLLHLTDAPPLGTGVTHALAVEHTLALPPGGTLVAYSDGLVERRDADLTEQLAALQDTVTASCDPIAERDLEQVADAIMAAFVPVPQDAADDVCLMVIRREPEAVPAGGS